MKKFRNKVYFEYRDVIEMKSRGLTPLSESMIHKRFYATKYKSKYGVKFVQGSWAISEELFGKIWTQRDIPGRKAHNIKRSKKA